MHNIANTGFNYKNCLPTDSIRAVLQGRAIIITRKGQSRVHRYVSAISKESCDLGYCWNDTPDYLPFNSYLEGFKLNKLESTRVNL